MDKPRRFDWWRAARILLLMLVLEALLCGVFTLLSPAIPSFEPGTAAVRRVNMTEAEVAEWDTGPISPDGTLSIGGMSAFEIQDAASGEVLSSITPSAPGYVTRAGWKDNDTVVFYVVDAGAYEWRWREQRLISIRDAFLVLFGVLPVLGIIGAYWWGRRSTDV